MSLLAAIDLLELSPEEQAIIRCLSQRQALTLPELAQQTQMPVALVEQTVAQMVRSARLVEQLREGQRLFSVRFRRKGTHIRNTPAAIQRMLDLPPTTFLGQALFTSSLDEQQRGDLLGRCERRLLVSGEVLVWQHAAFDAVGVVSIGLLKQSRLCGVGGAPHTSGYVRRGEWFGVTEVLSSYQSADTYTALSETEVLLWPIAEFVAFVAQHAPMSMAISTWASRQLHQQRELPGQLWVVEGAHPGAGSSTVAAQLAALTARETGEQATPTQQVLLWQTQGTADSSPNPQPSAVPGVDLLTQLAKTDYPAPVQIDMLLTDLQRRYRYILFDSGSSEAELLQLLRGRANTLISLTSDPNGVATINRRWAELKALARPGQRRFAVLNAAPASEHGIDAAFQLLLPYAPELPAAELLAPLAALSAYSEALHELYRRLSLTHTIGIFIPSTLDVATTVDNSHEVREAMQFLGLLFGGATKSEGEGVWKSEEHGLVVEQVTIVRSFVSRKALDHRLDDVVGFVTRLKQAMRQEAMAVDVDNQLVLV